MWLLDMCVVAVRPTWYPHNLSGQDRVSTQARLTSERAGPKRTYPIQKNEIGLWRQGLRFSRGLGVMKTLHRRGGVNSNCSEVLPLHRILREVVSQHISTGWLAMLAGRNAREW